MLLFRGDMEETTKIRIGVSSRTLFQKSFNEKRFFFQKKIDNA